jgi:hypothetical protein
MAGITTRPRVGVIAGVRSGSGATADGISGIGGEHRRWRPFQHISVDIPATDIQTVKNSATFTSAIINSHRVLPMSDERSIDRKECVSPIGRIVAII